MTKGNDTSHLESAAGRRRSSVVQAPELGDHVVVASDEVFRKMSMAIPNLAEVSRDAKNALDAEHNMGVMEALRRYPKAVFFSMILSFCLVMEGYDVALLFNFYGVTAFAKQFGKPVGDGTYQVRSNWQTGLQNGAQIGQISGLMIAGLIADRYGYKRTLLASLIFMIGCIFLFFFAQNIGMLFAAEVLAGLPWGAFQTLTTTYAADVCPIPLRPILTTFVNMCWVIGQLVAAGVLRGFVGGQDQWAWRIPYAVQWIWPVPIICGVVFAPESPYWLNRKGRKDDARQSLRALASQRVSDDEIENTLNMIEHTNELELQVSQGTSYFDCFKGTNRRRTEIACMAYVAQVFSGVWFGSQSSYFLEQAGFSPDKAYDFGLGTAAIAFVGTACAWFIMTKVGRRRLYLVGFMTFLAILLAVGVMGIPKPSNGIAYASGALLMLFILTYDLTVGPVAFCLIAEIPSTRLRIKTAVLARNSYNVASVCANFLNPPILNPTGWNLRGKGGFVWAPFTIIILVWSYFRLPEPMGLSPAELDVLFESGVSARKFRSVDIDIFRSEHLEAVDEKQSYTHQEKV